MLTIYIYNIQYVFRLYYLLASVERKPSLASCYMGHCKAQKNPGSLTSVGKQTLRIR